MSENLMSLVPARERVVVGEDHEFHAIITFNPPAMEESERAPLDIAVALDVSGSMRGSKIEAAKQSLLKLVEHLKADDRLSVVMFTNWVETLIAPTLMTPDNKAQARKAINGVSSHNSTNLSGGLFAALDHLKESKPLDGAVRRCLIFTDGQANQGITDRDKLAEMALEYRSGIGISAFGYGTDHDAKLLEQISQDGEFYYIDSPDKILTAFGAELGGLVTTFAQNVRLCLEPADGVEILEVLNDLTVKEDGPEVWVDCDDLLAEQPYSVVLRLKVAKRDKTFPRGITLVKVTASYLDVGIAKKRHERQPLKVRFVAKGKQDTKDNEAVLNEVALQKSIQAQAEAIKFADQGNFKGARDVLVAVGAFMRQEIGTDQAMALADVGDALASEDYVDHHAYAQGGSSKARSLRKGLSRRRVGAMASKGGVDLHRFAGTQAVNDMARSFEAASDDQDEESEDKSAKPEPKSKSLSKSRSRSRSSW